MEVHTGGARAIFALVFAAIVCLGAGLRFADLSAKPMHGDEANQAVKAGRLLEKSEYAYDPFEHHGPTLYYLTLPVFWATGTQHFVETEEWQYRVVPAMFGVLIITLLWGLREALGGPATLWAAGLCAVSNAMVYYSRYYIQETLFTCFALAAIVLWWRFAQRPGVGKALALGAALGLVYATKETSVLLFAAAGAAVCTVVLWQRVAGGAWPTLGAHLRVKYVVACVGVALLVSVVFYSSFGTHPRGVLDAILTYTRYFTRAEGAGSAAAHDKPFLYYLELLAFCYREPGPWWTEGFALATAGLGLLVALFVRGANTEAETSIAPVQFRRFLAVYALLLTLVFSLVPYKTPWNLLPFWQPLLMLSGVGIAWISLRWKRVWLRVALSALCLAGAAHAARQAWQGSFVYPADTRNPYVYAHTSTAIFRLAERVTQIAAVHPQGKELVIAVIGEGGDYWPLPWYLRGYPKVGYFPQPPKSLEGIDIVIASTRFAPALQEALGERYHAETGALRPGTLLGVFIKSDLWEKFMAGRS